MRLTIRGWTVLVAVVVAFLSSWQYGPRSLNAIVVPLVVVLAASLFTIGLRTQPSIERHPIDHGGVGDRRTVAITLETDDPIAATIRETVGDGLEPVDGEPVVETTLDDETRLSYDVDLEARGERMVGPLSVTVTDAFGLVTRRFDDDATASLLVYPDTYDLAGAAVQDVRAVGDTVRDDRDEFDHLRGYQRGDPMRDVHWKATAKRADGDLAVAEHVADGTVGSVTVAGECEPAYADELASAVGSIVIDLLEDGVDVGLAIGSDARSPGSGTRHRHDLLAVLAVTDGGELRERDRRNADVLVRTDADGTTVVVDDSEHAFARLHGGDRSEVVA